MITIQVVCGVGSHFNVETTFDRRIDLVMVASILVFWLVTVVLAVASDAPTPPHRAASHALKLGFAPTVIGTALGGLMMIPSAAQLAMDPSLLTASGGHTVGAPDGGPGIPMEYDGR